MLIGRNNDVSYKNAKKIDAQRVAREESELDILCTQKKHAIH
jgi:hypothetical protein